MSEAQHWVDEKERYDVFTLKHGDNITLTKDFESVSSSRELKRINLGIDYFLKNFSVDDYVLKVRSHNSAITLWIKGIYFEDLYVYSYDTKSNSFRSQNYLCGYNSSRYTPQCSKLDNNVKSRRRFIWFAKRLSMLDKDIIKHSTIKYTQNSYSIPTSVIAKHIKHTGKRFKKDIITKKVTDELEGINVLYDNKSLQYKEHEHSR